MNSNDVQIRIGAKLSPSLETGLARTDKRLARSRQRARKGAEDNAKANAQVVKTNGDQIKSSEKLSNAIGGVAQKTSVQTDESRDLIRSVIQLVQTQSRLIGQASRLGTQLDRVKTKTEQGVLLNNKLSKAQRRAAESTRRLNNEFEKGGRKANQFVRSLSSIVKVGRGIKGVLGTPMGMVAGLAGVGGAAAVLSDGVTSTVAMQERIARLQVATNMDSASAEALKQQVFSVSKRSDIAIKPDELLAAIEMIAEKSGDIAWARESMEVMAKAISATGVSGQFIGAEVNDAKYLWNIDSVDDLRRSIDTLVLQGKSGAFTMAKMATEGQEVSALMSSMGITGVAGKRDIGALLQVAMSGIGNSSETTTAVNALIRDMASNKDDLDEMGVDVFDQTQWAQGKQVLRNPLAILKDIYKASADPDDKHKINQLFSDEARKVLNRANTPEGQLALDRFRAIQGDGSELDRDSRIIAETAQGKFNVADITKQQIYDKQLGKHIDDLAQSISTMATTLDKTLDETNSMLRKVISRVDKMKPVADFGFEAFDFIASPPAWVGKRIFASPPPAVPPPNYSNKDDE